MFTTKIVKHQAFTFTTPLTTLLASGNVVFESEQVDKKALTIEIESLLKKAFEKDVSVILRSLDDLKKLHSSEPFKGIKVTSSIRLYVTFLSEKTRPHRITIPYTTLQKEFRILHVTPMEVFSVLDLSIGKGTPDAMNILEKEFGSNVTTSLIQGFSPFSELIRCHIRQFPIYFKNIKMNCYAS